MAATRALRQSIPHMPSRSGGKAADGHVVKRHSASVRRARASPVSAMQNPQTVIVNDALHDCALPDRPSQDPVPMNEPHSPWRLSVAPMMDWTDRHCRYFHRLITRHARLYTEMVKIGRAHV